MNQIETDMTKIIKSYEDLVEMDRWCSGHESFEGLGLKVIEDISLSLLRVDSLLEEREVLKEISPEPKLLTSILKDLRSNLLSFSVDSFEQSAMENADLVLIMEMLLYDDRSFLVRTIVTGLGSISYRPNPVVMVEGEN